jgi:hypothetical protein
MTPKKQVKIPDQLIANKIYIIRGYKVMLDTELAELYQVENKRLNEQIKRNLKRFPKDFMFQLTQKEWNQLKEEFGSGRTWGGRRYLPYVFTEHGVLMLSSVLNSDRAIEVNIQIMRIFVQLREILMDTTELKLEIIGIKKTLDKHNKSFEIIADYLDGLSEKVDEIEKKQNHHNRKRIGFKE